MHTLPEKIKALVDYKKPKLANELGRFLTMMNFYRRFIPHATHEQHALKSIIKGNKKNDTTELTWTTDAENTFAKCKMKLAHATALALPSSLGKLSLQVDDSNFPVEAVLHQTIKGETRPLGFFSKRMTDTQKKYSTYDR